MDKAERTATIGTVIALIVGTLLGLAGSDGGSELGGLPVFLLLTIIAFGVNVAAFVPSFLLRTEHYYDLVGSMTYIGTAILALVLSDGLDRRSVIIGVLVLIWAGRLGSFLFRRVKRVGKDGRFDKIKQSFPRFLTMWVVQGLWVTATAGAAYAAITSGSKQSFGVLGIIGLAIWVAGFTIEVIADRQKTAFKKDAANNGKFINTGLWAWSRHPNYFGEITLWTGMALIALPALQGWQYATLISPLFVYFLLTRISGVTMLERRSDKKWGGEADYETYKATTPVLVPQPPK